MSAATGRSDPVGAADCKEAANVWRWPGAAAASDEVAQETAVALVYNGLSHVVMMMTPADLGDFVLGFSLSEGIIADPAQLYDLEIHDREQGIEVAATISADRFAALKEVRRNLTGRTGCGLCGAESLAQAIRPVDAVADTVRIAAAAIDHAVAQLQQQQPLQSVTGAVHGAAWCDVEGNIRCLREDVGRHNALDKLIGALSRAKVASADGFALISSRASYEMVTKAARAGIQMLVAVSAPTSLAVRMADEAGMTLVGFARPGRFSVYSAQQRLDG